ncbi:hypothetical protein [Desmospora activa]|uniref:Uncharacterized protein n=1 Tax=Desmospora activa DSM 45169 TaxID=1121389 RepID=A0A2T4YZ27_9BACL|nr:hypothetical protein [Desmospora activa]PTM52192.1 hypothetical protein C8J48_3739 [Desmospora activa DSM 45169]
MSQTFRRKRIEDYILKLRRRVRTLEKQLSKNYVQDSEPLKLIIRGEIKAITQIIDELEDNFSVNQLGG